MESIRVVWASELAAHLEVPDGKMVPWYRAIRNAGISGVRDVVPGSRSLQVCVEAGEDPERIVAAVRVAVSANVESFVDPEPRVVEIPVCYDLDLGPDLEQLARDAGLTVGAAAQLHASGSYTVRFIGFVPGFAYIDGLPDLLRAPRLSSPRARVRVGSVGVAGSRTGVYPHSTAGGWRLVGATPTRMFEPLRAPAALLCAGDRVRFRQIDRDEFDALERGPS